MKEIVSKAMSSGMDLTRRGAVKAFLKRLDIDQDLYDRVYTELKNKAFEKEFKKVPFEDRIIFIPQCMRNSKKCQAELADDGYECKRCGACDIDEIISLADDLGYKKVYIVPGGSMVRKIIKKTNPGAVIGVACILEIAEAMELAVVHDVNPQGVSLLKDGCKDTIADMDELKRVMRMRS